LLKAFRDQILITLPEGICIIPSIFLLIVTRQADADGTGTIRRASVILIKNSFLSVDYFARAQSAAPSGKLRSQFAKFDHNFAVVITIAEL